MADIMREEEINKKPLGQVSFQGNFLLPDPKQPLAEASSLKITGTKNIISQPNQKMIDLAKIYSHSVSYITENRNLYFNDIATKSDELIAKEPQDFVEWFSVAYLSRSQLEMI